jgi:adenylate cyclase
MRFRIGVHLGDLIEKPDGTIYGDGVNIAARLEGLAEPGGVTVSESIRTAVKGKVGAAFEDQGMQQVKNIADPVRVYRVGPQSSVATRAAAGGDANLLVTDKPSIAVLPFTNMSGDPEQEYFSDGISEDIVTDLSKVSALTVVSRVTAFSFKGKPVDVAQVARQLKVSHVLEGSVRKAGNRVRITAQLIEAASDSHLWAERYDRNVDDIFALQDEISEAIVKALKLTLLPGEREAIEKRSTTNPEAYKLYLMARQYNATGNTRHREITVRLCKRAVEIDPNYARAWALLSISQSNKVLLVTQPGDTGWDAAERALALAPDLAEAHSAKARVLGDAGRYEDSLAEHTIAQRLDPDAYEVNAGAARCLMAMRRYREAIQCFEKAATALEADFWALGMSISCHEALGDREGMRDAARRTLARVEKTIVAEPDHGLALSFGVASLSVLGEADRAKEWAGRAVLLDPENPNLMYNLGCSMIKLAEIDEALKLLAPVLGTAQKQSLNWWRIDPDLDPIRSDPRFKAMLEQAETRLAS